MKSTSQLTLRGFSKELLQILKETARRRGISLNKAAIYLMRRGAGLKDAGNELEHIGSTLDKYAGSWSSSEARQVDRAVEELDQVADEGFWE